MSMENSTIENPINGLEIEKYNGCYLFRIEEFSNEIKDLIKEQFAEIWNGLIQVDEDPVFFSLKKTVIVFLDRYNSKSNKIKKGMIGELLAHLLINNFAVDLKPLSILKNKEERSIKKGFDILYYDFSTESIWYSEVKSGEATSSENRPNNLASNHLDKAKQSISEMFNSGRRSLWESALIDVKLTVEESEHRNDFSDLLKIDSENISSDNKSVILISVLFHNLSEKISLEFIISYYEDLIAEAKFSSQILFSIHKETYQAVEDFLTNLAEETDA
jgi:hypothetical protein